MAAATISSLDSAPRRIPKLAVRNRFPEAESVDEKTPLMDTRRDSKMRPPLSYGSDQTLTPSLIRRPSNLSQMDEGGREGYGRGRSESIASTTQRPKKKKSSGMLSFLTLKEPSTSAWEEYANAQKKAAAGKNSKASQKLPAFVPATNSKWDGLPENTSAKRTSLHSNTNSRRFSTFSNTSKQTGRTISTSYSDNSSETSSARRYGSLSSKPSRAQSNSLPGSKPGSIHSRPSTETGKPLGIHTTITAIHPALRNTAVAPWDEPPELIEEEPVEEERQSEESAQTFLYPPSPPPELELLSLLPTPELELPELSRPTGYTTTPEHSPRTPPADFALNLIDAIAQTQIENGGKHDSQQSPVLGTFWHSDTDTETESIKTGRPLSTNFSRPVISRIPPMALIPEQTLPDEPDFNDEAEDDQDDVQAFQSTLRDSTGRTSPFVFETTPLARPPMPHRTSSQSTEVGRKYSTSSRWTSMTVTTATTGAPALASPTFSTMTSTSTRPTTAATRDISASDQTGAESEGEEGVDEWEDANKASHPTSDPSPSPPRSNSDATSLAPSEVSVQWKMTPKERLGLGSRLSKIKAENDVLPWEADGLGSRRASGTSDVQAKRHSVVSQMSVGEGGKLRRLSLRLSRK